ncbi:hypothetical protein ACFQHV_06800 [Promicromonospora thailandica]|uniref:Secreted protein n=1 Tax=Promicromonospora thailandica TaxID=765201 RepID=A0A9X2GC16_9MICO|nr:hypothetical protein [Promicromonospora thailandica]MCP2266351.1 hypothetical protein [Promicromonospora thailandica]
MRRLHRVAAAVAALGIATALAAVAPAQADDSAELTAVPASSSPRLASTGAAPNAEVYYRACKPGVGQPAQVRSCMYLYKDGPRFFGEAMVTDMEGGKNYSVLAVDLRIQAYADGKWQQLRGTWKTDADGWFDYRDRAYHTNWMTCSGAGQTLPLRAAATIRYKLADGTQRTTVTRYSPSARTWCP